MYTGVVNNAAYMVCPSFSRGIILKFIHARCARRESKLHEPFSLTCKIIIEIHKFCDDETLNCVARILM